MRRLIMNASPLFSEPFFFRKSVRGSGEIGVGSSWELLRTGQEKEGPLLPDGIRYPKAPLTGRDQLSIGGTSTTRSLLRMCHTSAPVTRRRVARFLSLLCGFVWLYRQPFEPRHVRSKPRVQPYST